MTSRDFAFWLQGYFEIGAHPDGAPKGLSFEQVECIRRHLNLVFKHEIDPSMGPAEHQKELSATHDAVKPSVFPPGESMFRPGGGLRC